MSDHTLPDDCSRWPDSPFELLGVSPGVNERDLRRAYASLIRTFKPEQFPEHFRRIREAYEAVRNYARFFSAFQAPGDEPGPPADDHPAERPEAITPEASGTSPPLEDCAEPLRLTMPRSLEDELDEAWDRAVDGDEAGAYARLLELHERQPWRSETCLRLYCLLSVARHLDSGREPCDFLAQGLRRTGGSGPCHEMYRREVEENPDEALTERFAGVMDAATQPGLFATLVEWRWRAAGARGQLGVIVDDLPARRERLAGDQEEVWLRLLTCAADQLAWGTSLAASAGFGECLKEAARHEHLQLRCADVFDRLEYLERAARGWHALREVGKVPTEFLDLLARYWARPFSEVRPGVVALLATISAETDVWFAHLDRVNEASPELLSLLGQVLDSYQWSLDREADDRDPAALAILARHFLEEHGTLGYFTFRPRLLAFCLREVIHPDVVAELAVNTVAISEVRLRQLVKDWPLRHIYRARALFRY
jgi:hypothetical protein